MSAFIEQDIGSKHYYLNLYECYIECHTWNWIYLKLHKGILASFCIFNMLI